MSEFKTKIHTITEEINKSNNNKTDGKPANAVNEGRIPVSDSTILISTI